MTGLVALGVGFVVASGQLRTARRVYNRTLARFGTILDGWASWFLVGFSTVTMGIHGVSAVAAWLVWTAAGTCLIGLGIRLVVHA